MPLDYNGETIRVGDYVRRIPKFQSKEWKFAGESLRVNYVGYDSITVDNSRSIWSSNRFEKVNKMEIMDCVKITPAQAEKIEIIPGKLTQFFTVAPTVDNGFICLRDSSQNLIGTMDSKTLRENAYALSRLADALDKINKR